jgi:hypothetical protein
MREIKFRAWDKEDKLMDYAYYVADDGDINWFEFSKAVRRNNILMQYTGVKDKNGKEIYEGDIITDWCGDRRSVGWYETGFWVKRPNGDLVWPNADILEVVGNIYENPELLKEK